jgi:hypothetical protein
MARGFGVILRFAGFGVAQRLIRKTFLHRVIHMRRIAHWCQQIGRILGAQLREATMAAGMLIFKIAVDDCQCLTWET